MPLQMNFSLLTPAKQVEKFRSSHLAYWWRTLGNQDTRSPRQTDDPCIQIPPAAELGVYLTVPVNAQFLPERMTVTGGLKYLSTGSFLTGFWIGHSRNDTFFPCTVRIRSRYWVYTGPAHRFYGERYVVLGQEYL